MAHIVIVGAGQAGFSAAFKVRALGFCGEITLVGEETSPPYQRPPLSKAYLLGDMTKGRLFLRPLQSYADENIRLEMGKSVSRINPTERSVVLTSEIGDETLSYDDLILTTGASPLKLPARMGGDLDGVYTIRSLAHIDKMAPAMVPGAKVLIVGGGYIGLEAAAVAAKMGLEVTLVEMADRILQRVAAPETSDFFRELHTAHGVRIIEGVGLSKLHGEQKVQSASLTDGTELDVDFVIVGIGVRPAVDLAEQAGVAIENGISVDAQGHTNVDHIWAAGDCASFPYHGARIRLESVPNAIDQANVVAENVMGGARDYVAKPWFWSDQYDVKLQIAGLNTGYDTVVKRVGRGVVSHWYFKGPKLLAVDALNAPRDYMFGKKLIENGKTVPKDSVADPETNLKTFL